MMKCMYAFSFIRSLIRGRDTMHCEQRYIYMALYKIRSNKCPCRLWSNY